MKEVRKRLHNKTLYNKYCPAHRDVPDSTVSAFKSVLEETYMHYFTVWNTTSPVMSLKKTLYFPLGTMKFLSPDKVR